MSIGINKWRNDPENIQQSIVKSSCSVHAEVDALSRVNDPRGATLYVARISRAGKNLLSAPCPNCWESITNAGIRKVVFT
jgi:deoxycytidylate deaminase